MQHHVVRLKRCFSSPPYILIHPVTAGYLLPLVHIYISFYVLPSAIWQLPFVIWSLVLVNGLIARQRYAERSQEFLYWEDFVGPSQIPGPIEKLRRITKLVTKLQGGLGKGANAIECLMNLHNFTNPAVSVFCYFFELVVAAVVATILTLVQVWALYFVAGAMFLFPFSLRAFSGRASQLNQLQPLSDKKAPVEMKAKRGFYAEWVTNILSRVPNGDTVAHYHFCSLQQLDDGQLMAPARP